MRESPPGSRRVMAQVPWVVPLAEAEARIVVHHVNGSAGQRDSPTSLSLDVHRAAQPRSAATAVRRRQGPSAATGKIPKAKSNARGAMLAEAQAAVAAKGSTLMPDAPAESGPSSDDEVMFTCDSACGPNELAA
eukprot:CAMPEP_0185211810 /NCGR_PEP_ID=MMETSP1140-20130426/67212_1 /TAXON_ID=298111 /ORGANISM="Pavlova sp., Strain CCMP459" /LENGTH=133 /DNA_ID=CAMNT_0027779653 /DNA_START=170 /DNA_END=572 /DNA_ORIENTATION=+